MLNMYFQIPANLIKLYELADELRKLGVRITRSSSQRAPIDAADDETDIFNPFAAYEPREEAA